MSSKFATFQNVQVGAETQRITIEIDQYGTISASANKSTTEGGGAARFQYVGGKFEPLNDDAEKFLFTKQNETNLYDRLTELVDIQNPKTKQKVIEASGFVPNNQNQANSSDTNEETTPPGTAGTDKPSGKPFNLNLSNLQDQSVDYPTDHTYFKGRYPINQKDSDDFDHFKITCYDHEPAGLEANQFILPDIDDRKKVRRGVVTLPMQPGIQEGNTVNWGPENINPLQILGLGVANDLMDLNAAGAMDNLIAALGTGAGDLTPDVIKSYFAGKAIGANVLGRATGQTINNNVEVLFNGPGLRTFNYNYRFTPREPKEAKEIKNIIRFFKKQMAPKRSTSRIFLKSPNVFKLKYQFKNGDHPFLNNIKMCALNGFTVDYTPDGSYSTYNDDGGEGDGSMTSYNVGLSFMEMTPIYNEDFFRDSEGKEGTGF